MSQWKYYWQGWQATLDYPDCLYHKEEFDEDYDTIQREITKDVERRGNIN
ncbi:MAG: hypothetical protein ACFFCW_04685 [Candidatus Hodarchaeota archaeon]